MTVETKELFELYDELLFDHMIISYETPKDAITSLIFTIHTENINAVVVD